jgi:Protein of unknown function (DUF998)
VAIVLLLSSAGGLVLLHLLRSDLSPLRDRLSEYANGSFGAVMTVSFFALGAGLLVLGSAVWATPAATGWPRVVPLAVIFAGCGMVVSGLYPTDPAGAPTATERVHSLASGSATLALIGAAVVSSLVRPDPRVRRAIGPAGVLAGAALAFGAVSPVLHGTVWTGLSQRLLWVTLMGWLLVGPARSPQAAARSAGATLRRAQPPVEVPADRPRVDGPASTD